MLRLADSSLTEELKLLCQNNPTGAMIYAFADVFGGDGTTAQCWLQKKGDTSAAALSLFEGILNIYAEEKANFDELREFAKVLNPSYIFSDKKTYEMLGFARADNGPIMTLTEKRERIPLSGNQNAAQYIGKADSESVKYLHEIIYGKDAKAKDINAFSLWYTDVSHRIRHSFIRAYCAFDNGLPVSAAMTTAETPQAAIIGAVATLPGYRNKGLARSCISYLAKELSDEGKNVSLFCDINSPHSLYREIGFTNSGIWVKSFVDETF